MGRLHEAAALLEQLLLQDIGRREDGIYLKQGVSPDRVVSVHDPEMRHGRKSASKRFDGHKALVAVDPESQLIMAADVMAGNVQDHERALELVEQVEANAEVTVEETAPTEIAVPARPSPRPDGSWWPRWQTGAARPDSPKTTSGSTWRR